MGNTRETTRAEHNTDMMHKVCKLLGIRNDFKLWEIIKQLELKQIKLSPFHIHTALMEESGVFGSNTRFMLIKQIALDLWEQGIYIPFPGDKVRYNKLGQLVVLSEYHSKEPIPNTIHNKVARDLRLACADFDVWAAHRRFIACLAHVIHGRWVNFQRWQPHDFFNPSETDDCYVKAAFELAKEYHEDYRRKGSYQPTINLGKELFLERFPDAAKHVKAIIG